ncbi:hypothetical protein C3F00_003485 [Pseudomonas sp. MWU13-2860]|nr:hypothetical protein C3F00_003485 [Pseudomonas sp. MWU13-2860]
MRILSAASKCEADADLENTTEPVGAGLAREEALKIAKSFAGKPCSYRMCVVFQISDKGGCDQRSLLQENRRPEINSTSISHSPHEYSALVLFNL